MSRTPNELAQWQALLGELLNSSRVAATSDFPNNETKLDDVTDRKKKPKLPDGIDRFVTELLLEVLATGPAPDNDRWKAWDLRCRLGKDHADYLSFLEKRDEHFRAHHESDIKTFAEMDRDQQPGGLSLDHLLREIEKLLSSQSGLEGVKRVQELLKRRSDPNVG